MLAENISNQDINKLELKVFEGKINLITDPSDLRKVFKTLKKEKTLGFDTETKPAFRKGQVHEVSLIQIATEEEVHLIRVNNTGITNEIHEFLENEKIKKIGVALRDDLKDIQRLRKFNPAGFVELNKLVKEIGIESNGLRKLTAIILGFRISKSAQTSNWENSELSKKQLEYAATDAWVCIRMYKELVRKGYLDQL